MVEEQPQKEPEQQAEAEPLRQIPKEELTEILEKHKTWLKTKGKEGERANLSQTNLAEAFREAGRDLDFSRALMVGVDLKKVELNGSQFVETELAESDLQQCRFDGANLSGANLRGAKLGRAQFPSAILTNAILREAFLEDADLKAAINLRSEQLGGADASNAKLPDDIAKFDGLKTVEEAVKSAKKIFASMLLGCAYSWLTIATTTDAKLLTNSASTPLPIIQTPIPIAVFYWAAPLLLLGLYVYFHFYMQRIWEGLAELPAVFPDGRPLDKKAYPWLLIGLVRAHFKLLRGDRPPLSRPQNLLAILLAWWAVPLTLFLLWARYLPAHDLNWLGTPFHVLLLTAAFGFGAHSCLLSRATLRLAGWRPFLRRRAFREGRTYEFAGWVLAAFLFFFVFSYGAIEGLPAPGYSPPILTKERSIEFSGEVSLWRTFQVWARDARKWVPIIFAFFGYDVTANVEREDLSVRPPGWTGEPAMIKGALLRGKDLRHMNAQRAFLVNADLRDADLEGAKLRGADLRGADLRGAKGLARHQLDDACGDGRTSLPSGLTIKPCKN